MLFSKDDRAHWDFVDQAGMAHVDWLHHCDQADFDAFTNQQEADGVAEMFPPAPPDRDETDALLKHEATAYLQERLRHLLATRRQLRPVDAIEEAYGEMLGRARATHLRAALAALYREGLIDDDLRNAYYLRCIRWRGR